MSHSPLQPNIYSSKQLPLSLPASSSFLQKMTPSSLLSFILLLTSLTLSISTPSLSSNKKPDNETIYKTSKQLCIGCTYESLQFLFAQNMVRAAKWEIPLGWDFQLQKYAQWWAGQRKGDCQLMHSFPEDDFKLGENIYWGSGSSWTPVDAVNTWAGEERYYRYGANTCASGQQCGHYTQIVWKTTRRVGCARVVCDSGDVFMTCNYDPVGNVIGERPY
ncbi:putative CAP domain-containing protein [Helianthus annuus]|nr:putative CAP domain-containing protein [Helianthus annuus]KAJ0749339.1 putative CAP domain-containing protein [Helianthus annuus]KAJ0921599.1 putative CAP superfamily protein [Helianthus annuus]